MFSLAWRTAPILPSMPRTPKPPGISTPSTPSRCRAASSGVLAVIAWHPADVDLGVVAETAGAQCLRRRQVRVRQVDVLADQRDRDAARRPVHPAEQLVPVAPVNVPERQAEPPYGVGVQTLRVQDLRDVVDRRRVRRRYHGLLIDVAHQADLPLQPAADRPVRPAHDRVRLDADAAQRGDGMLGRLGLELTRTGRCRAEEIRAGRSIDPGRSRA